ncbi:alpha/beta hydrolase [Endozoicomonas sp.]|uniref:alpha/beta hydrolase n=1 Tax=Endozoicomonas sp. TaxID=1892382 RepID=UPI00383AF7AD
MNTRKLLLITPLMLGLAAACQAETTSAVVENNLQQHKNFRAELDFSNQNEWYRELRISDWKSLGLIEADLQSVLPRIHGDGPLRDSTNENNAGQWTFEWSRQAVSVALIADKESRKTKAAELYQRASTLYLIASYPNLLTDHEQAALAKSVTFYIKAAQLKGERVSAVRLPLSSGGSVNGLLHLPTQVTQVTGVIKSRAENWPVVLWSGGSDITLVEHKRSIADYVAEGYGVVTFDIPGGGLNKGLKIQPGKESQVHDAALQFVRESPILDENRVAALTSSAGGVSLMEFTLKNPQLKAVVARCTLVDGVLTEPDKIQFLPDMTVDSFLARLGVNYQTLDNPGVITRPLSLKTKGYFDGQTRTDVPLLVINTKDDPIASPKDMQATAAMSSRGEVAYFGERGHCPESDAAESRIYAFITGQL